MYLADILEQAREQLREVVTFVEARNIADGFQAYTAGAPPTAPWASTGAQPPTVESYSSSLQLKIEAAGAAGTVGIDISSQVAEDGRPIHLSFDLKRAVSSANEVLICGINNNSALTSGAAFALLKVAADTSIQINTYDGWINLATLFTVATSFHIDIWLHETYFQVALDSIVIGQSIRRNYPGLYSSKNHGYLYFPATAHATANMYVDNLNSQAPPTVFGEMKWKQKELSHYANVGVKFFRQILPDEALHRYIEATSQNTSNAVATYTLPSGYQRIIAATLNGKSVSLLDPPQFLRNKEYLGSSHYLTTTLAGFPFGTLYNGVIEVYPVPTGAVALIVYNIPEAVTMDIDNPATATPELPEDMHPLLVDFVVMKAREKNREDISSVRGDMEAMTQAITVKYSGKKLASPTG